MKIAAVIYNLSAGGAERVLVTLATGWQSCGHKVTVITLDTTQSDFYTLPTGVNHIALGVAGYSGNAFQAVSNNLKRIKRLRQAITRDKPDVIVSSMERTNILTLFASRPLKVPVIVMEHAPTNMNDIGLIWSILRQITYRWASALVSVSKVIDECFKWLAEDKRWMIYNPIGLLPMNAPPELSLNPKRKYLIGMGRLSHEKGFDILIGIFRKLTDRYPQWDLILLGEGSERTKLDAVINQYGLGQRVLLPGNIRNPYPILKQCQIFILSSRTEGLPMALIEALACGLPSISFDCQSGPAEIIHNDINGILVPDKDTDGLQRAMENLMSDDAKCKRLASQAPASTERFRLDRIMQEWEQLIGKIVH
jgi:glycosyltransferase involved in cell wall biosynthesis